ncbi:hypothetical protein [Candidatus Tisiphia endosymbiont of Nemotelus uliginosus]|uniref:hypothetical protein n=1 Tax=Candidatus Tisiphia endosymbiont of Nemotelus uliginosus TaxID=3077926 RepID=UPI0035C93775
MSSSVISNRRATSDNVPNFSSIDYTSKLFGHFKSTPLLRITNIIRLKSSRTSYRWKCKSYFLNMIIQLLIISRQF